MNRIAKIAVLAGLMATTAACTRIETGRRSSYFPD